MPFHAQTMYRRKYTPPLALFLSSIKRKANDLVLFLMHQRIYFALLTLKGLVTPGNKLANIVAHKHIVGISVTLKHRRLSCTRKEHAT